MRLTEKDLPELNKIQEELGIDLITLFTILKHRVIYFPDGTYSYDFDIEHTSKWIICDYVYGKIIDVKNYGIDYGLDYSLTKKELL